MLKSKRMPAAVMPKGGERRPMARPTGALSAMSAPNMRGAAAPRMESRMRLKEGGESKAEHAMEMKKMASTEAKLKKHADMPASKAHKGLKTGGVANAQGGYKTGGVANAQGGYKTGGAIKPSKYKEGGFVAMKGNDCGHKAMKKGGSCH